MSNRPFFTVIIPTYNRKSFLKIALDSVLSQTFKNYQIIVIDDGSRDQTGKLIKDYKVYPIDYYYQKNQGPASARNLGLSKSKGIYICFLDSDDRFRHDKLEITHNHIKKNPGYQIFHTEEIWFRRGKLLAQKKYHKKPSGYVFKEAIRLCSISMSTAAIKKEVFSQVGFFDPNLPACEDYEFWLRTTAKYPVYLIPKFLTIKEGGHPGQLSKKYPAMDKFRIYALEKLLKNKNLDRKKYELALSELKHKCQIYLAGAKKRKKSQEIEKYQFILSQYQENYG